ncbi:MAG TPA: hypothetical protein VGX46_12390 [Vicinamibacterales bacterium]|jgi:hypothetical protein|nr:hypothetical protein [Vicinamibacterales bacterium]
MLVMVAGLAWLCSVATSARERATQEHGWQPAYKSWGDPDLEGIWTADEMDGVPLERAKRSGADRLTEAEAVARVSTHLDNFVNIDTVGNYGIEWRDTAPGLSRYKPSTQASVVIDPPDGRLPPLIPEAAQRLAAAAQRANLGRPGSWEDLSTWQRCITRGLPLDAQVYNNGLQIVQSHGVVTMLREMIHEVRVIPLDGRPHLPATVTQWLGDSVGHWEGATLVVDVTNFNAGTNFHGSGTRLHLIEYFTRLSPDKLEYRFTVDDPTTWTKPWTGRLTLTRDAHYGLFEYACHEGNYSLPNTLSGARAEERRVNVRH